MSVAKLSGILVATVGLHKSWTAQDVSSPTEQAPVINLWDWILRKMRDGTMLMKSVFWTVGIIEAAVIIANEFPTEPLSKAILSTLMMSGRTQSLLTMNRTAITGASLIALGTLYRMHCYRVMKGFFTFDLSVRQNHKLIKTGPYSLVRHPSYLGLLVVYAGMFCWYGTGGSWLRESGILDTTGGSVFFGGFTVTMVTFMVGLLRRMTIEDAAMRKRFGQEWDDWAREVPDMVIPGVI